MELICLIEEVNPVSNRLASIYIEADSIWLYLTDPEQSGIESDCWLSNKSVIPEPIDFEVYKQESFPPPAPATELTSDYQPLLGDSGDWEFVWSDDGDSVCALFKGDYIGFIKAGTKHGFAKYLKRTGPWGHKWDATIYEQLFSVGG